MNLDAYLNRAMLSNQIAIGQAVSILSWSRYVGRVGENIHTLFQPYQTLAQFIPYIGTWLSQLISTYQKGIEANAKIVKTAGTFYAGVFIPVANTMDAVYSGASQAFNLALAVSTPNGAVQKTVEQVVKLNAGPDARVLNYTPAGYTATIAPYWNARRSFVTTWGGKADPNGSDPGGRARMASMINEGSQAFTRDRDHDFGPGLFNFSLWIAGVGSHKSGGSQLSLNSDGRYVWSGADSVNTYLWFRTITWTGIKKKTIYNDAWAWGGAWSLPSESSFRYYQTDYTNRTWRYPYVDPQIAGDQKSVMDRTGAVYQSAWQRDSRGMYKIVRDDSDRFAPDYFPDAGVGRADTREANGIARYRDLKWNGNRPREDMTDSAPRYLVVVDLPIAKVRDSATALGISHDPDASNAKLGWLNMHLQSKGAGRNEGVRAAAAAQVYFRRPQSLWPRSDGLDERANLFSPFWTARLVDLNTTEKAQVLALNATE
ncbi:pilus assembly protein TadG-related protein [Acidithiobacillus sp. AC3]